MKSVKILNLNMLSCQIKNLSFRFVLHLLMLDSLIHCNDTIVSQVLREHTITTKNGRVMKISYISTKIENKILQVVPIGGKMVRNSFECRKHCALTVNCIALNLQPANATYFNCHLLDKDHYKRPHLFVDSIGGEYHVVSVRI